MSAVRIQCFDCMRSYAEANGRATTKRQNKFQSLAVPSHRCGMYHPAAGGDLDLRASLCAIHLVLQCWEWIQCVCASVCSSGLLHARPLGWHHSVQNLMRALLFSRGNGVCVPAQLSRLKAGWEG